MPDYSREDFLSEILPFLSYLMTVSVQILVPVSSFSFVSKKDSLLTDYNVVDDLVYEKSVMVAKAILLPILRSTKSKIETTFETRLPLFITYVSEITSILHNQQSSIQYWTKKDVEILEEGKKRISKIKWIDDESRQNAIEIIDILIGYYRNMSIIIQNRKSELEEALQKIDSEDLKTSLYGAILGYACLTIMTDPKGKKLVPHKKFKPIAKLGLELARNLNHYANPLYDLARAYKSTYEEPILNLQTIAIPASENTINKNKMVFEEFVKKNIDNDQYSGKYVAFVEGGFYKAGNIRNQLVKEIYDKFGNVPMFVEKVSLKRREILFDTLE